MEQAIRNKIAKKLDKMQKDYTIIKKVEITRVYLGTTAPM